MPFIDINSLGSQGASSSPTPVDPATNTDASTPAPITPVSASSVVDATGTQYIAPVAEDQPVSSQPVIDQVETDENETNIQITPGVEGVTEIKGPELESSEAITPAGQLAGVDVDQVITQSQAELEKTKSPLPETTPEPVPLSADIQFDQRAVAPATETPAEEIAPVEPEVSSEPAPVAETVQDMSTVPVAESADGLVFDAVPAVEPEIQQPTEPVTIEQAAEGTAQVLPEQTTQETAPVETPADTVSTSVEPAPVEPMPVVEPVHAEVSDQPVPAEQQIQEAPSEQTAPTTEVTASAEGTSMPSIESLEAVQSGNFDLNTLLQAAVGMKASDVHLSADYSPMARVDSKLVALGSGKLTEENLIQMLSPLVATRGKKIEEVDDLDLSYAISEQARFRVNVFRQKRSIAAAFRLIPEQILTIEQLNLPGIIKQFTGYEQGFVLVTGPTGSGKTTTLASLINEINFKQPKHIITLEDPIEYVYPKGKALIDQREIKTDTESWNTALRAALRQDPDIVLVGEMRDLEAISTTMTIAETGHLVFATLHTNSASQTIDRIIDVFPEHQQNQVRTQLASVLTAVVSQRLIPLANGGRKPAVEILVATSAVRNAIRENKVYQIDNMIQTGAELGMMTLEKSLVDLIRQGMLTPEDAQRYANKPDDVITLLGKQIRPSQSFNN